MATVYGLRGEQASRMRWLDVVEGLTPLDRPLCDEWVSEMFEALLLLHDGRSDEAASMLVADVADAGAWPGESAWRTWYAALAAEAAVLSRKPDTAPLRIAGGIVEGNPVAAALVERAQALAAGDSAGVRAAGEALKSAGCRYQWARSLWLAGDGEEALSAMGATTHR